MSSYTYGNRVQRNSASNARPGGGYHRGLNALTRLTGPKGTSIPIVSKNVPKPVQTSSLKKENGGQDVTAILVNRNNAPGKKIGWGSALSSTPASAGGHAEPTPAEIASHAAPGKPLSQSESSQQSLASHSHQHSQSSLPPPSSNRNVPWALHPPAQPAPSTVSKPNSSAEEPSPRGRSPRPSNHDRGTQRGRYSYQNYYDQDRDRYNPRSYSAGHSYNGPYRYDRDDRFHRRPTEPREPPFNDRGDFRDYPTDRDHDGSYEPRYDARQRDYRDRRWYDPDRERAPPPYDARNHQPLPNSYYKSEDRRWGDDDDNDSYTQQRSYGPDHRESQRHHVPVYGNDHMRERDHYHRAKPYFAANRRSDGYDAPQHPSYSPERSASNVEHRRRSEPLPEDFQRQSTSKSEEDAILQSIRERDAAEARARQIKEMSSSDDRMKAERKPEPEIKQPVRGAPIVILRNKQMNVEVSNDGGAIGQPKIQQSHIEEKEISPSRDTDVQTTAEIKESFEEQRMKGQTRENGNMTLRDVNMQQIEEKRMKDEIARQQQRNVLRQVAFARENSTTSKEKYEKKDLINENQQQKAKESKQQQNLPRQHSKEIKPVCMEKFNSLSTDEKRIQEDRREENMAPKPTAEKVSENQRNKDMGSRMSNRDQVQDERKNTIRQSAAISENSKSAVEPVDETVGNKERSVNERQHTLDKGTPTQATGSKPENDQSGDVSAEQQDILIAEDIATAPSPKEKRYKNDREALEAAARAARAENRRTRGPRTKGVLFRRLPDGTLVNADLSEEEIARREERKKARLERIKAKEERIKARKAAREARLKAREERNKKRKGASQNNEDKVPNAIKSDSKPKPFIPAPPPVVSAWEAGPPRSIIQTSQQLPVPSEVPFKFSTEMVIEDITTDSDDESSITSPSHLTPSSISDKSGSDHPVNLPTEPDTDKFGPLEKHWNQPSVNSGSVNKKSTGSAQFAMKPLTLPMTAGVATWNTFGAANLFAPPHQESNAMSASWGLGQNTDAMVGNAISWPDATPAPVTQPTNEEEDAAALTDASAAVPRDLLSSAHASEEDKEASNEGQKGKPNYKTKNRGQPNKNFRKGPRNRSYKNSWRGKDKNSSREVSQKTKPSEQPDNVVKEARDSNVPRRSSQSRGKPQFRKNRGSRSREHAPRPVGENQNKTNNRRKKTNPRNQQSKPRSKDVPSSGEVA